MVIGMRRLQSWTGARQVDKKGSIEEVAFGEVGKKFRIESKTWGSPAVQPCAVQRCSG